MGVGYLCVGVVGGVDGFFVVVVGCGCGVGVGVGGDLFDCYVLGCFGCGFVVVWYCCYWFGG